MKVPSLFKNGIHRLLPSLFPPSCLRLAFSPLLQLFAGSPPSPPFDPPLEIDKTSPFPLRYRGRKTAGLLPPFSGQLFFPLERKEVVFFFFPPSRVQKELIKRRRARTSPPPFLFSRLSNPPRSGAEVFLLPPFLPDDKLPIGKKSRRFSPPFLWYDLVLSPLDIEKSFETPPFPLLFPLSLSRPRRRKEDPFSTLVSSLPYLYIFFLFSSFSWRKLIR